MINFTFRVKAPKPSKIGVNRHSKPNVHNIKTCILGKILFAVVILVSILTDMLYVNLLAQTISEINRKY